MLNPFRDSVLCASRCARLHCGWRDNPSSGRWVRKPRTCLKDEGVSMCAGCRKTCPMLTSAAWLSSGDHGVPSMLCANSLSHFLRHWAVAVSCTRSLQRRSDVGLTLKWSVLRIHPLVEGAKVLPRAGTRVKYSTFSHSSYKRLWTPLALTFWAARRAQQSSTNLSQIRIRAACESADEAFHKVGTSISEAVPLLLGYSKMVMLSTLLILRISWSGTKIAGSLSHFSMTGCQACPANPPDASQSELRPIRRIATASVSPYFASTPMRIGLLPWSAGSSGLLFALRNPQSIEVGPRLPPPDLWGSLLLPLTRWENHGQYEMWVSMGSMRFES